MTSLTPEFFFQLEQLSLPALVNALVEVASKRDLQGLEAFIIHAERHGLSEHRALNQIMTVYTSQEATNDRFPSSSERLTDVLACALSPKISFKNDLQKNTEAWTAQHADLASRLVALMARLQGPLKNVLLKDFAFDFTAQVFNAAVIHQMIEAGVDPMAKGAPRNGNIHCLAKHAMLAGNLPACTALVDAMDGSRAKEFSAMLSHPLDFETSNAMVDVLFDGNDLSPCLEKLDERAGVLAVGGFRMKTLMCYLVAGSTQPRPWDSFELGQIVGVFPGQSFEAAPLIKVLARHEVAKSHQEMGRKVLDAAIETHCTDLLKACSPSLSDHHGPNKAFSLAQTFESGSMPIAHPDGSVDTACAGRFKETVQLMLAHGFALNPRETVFVGKPLSHALAANPNEADRLAKLAILLELGLDPAAKDENEKSACERLENDTERDRWMSVIRSFEARTVARQLIGEIENEQGGPGLR